MSRNPQILCIDSPRQRICTWKILLMSHFVGSEDNAGNIPANSALLNALLTALMISTEEKAAPDNESAAILCAEMISSETA